MLDSGNLIHQIPVIVKNSDGSPQHEAIVALLNRILQLIELGSRSRIEPGIAYSENILIANLQKELNKMVAISHVEAVHAVNRLNKIISNRRCRQITELQLQIVQICKEILDANEHLVRRCDDNVRSVCVQQLERLDELDYRFIGIVGFFMRLPVALPKQAKKSGVAALINRFEN